MLPILFSDTGATSQDGSHSAIFRMQGPEGCALTCPDDKKVGPQVLFKLPQFLVNETIYTE